jgi:cell division protein FtsW
MKVFLVSEFDATARSALICTTAFLTAIGLIAIYSSSAIPGAVHLNNSFAFFSKHALGAVIGFTLIFALGHTPFKWIDRSFIVFIALSIALLVAVPFVGITANGAKRWIYVLGFTIQPAELLKLGLILYMAKNLSREHCDVNDLGQMFWTLILPLIGISALLLLQPDFGTVAVIWSMAFVMVVIAGLRPKYITYTGVFLGATLIAIAIQSPYRLQRIMTFLNPWDKFQTEGFQIIQSFLGFQNGGILGVGLGESKQKLFFLPEAHTDFIIAVVGEELGLLGVLTVCLFFLYFSFLAFQIASNQINIYRRFLAFGIGILITIQAVINLGVCLGALPTKGMALPFISMGANALVINLFAVAILARISQEAPLAKDALR